MFAFIVITKGLKMTNFGDKRVLAEQIYHAHYTANVIEDEIRKIRREDFPYRKKYDELKNGSKDE